MTWNYRVVKSVNAGETTYGIHEVYYDDNGKPVSCTVDPMAPMGEKLVEVYSDMQYMLKAFDYPTLTEEDFS